MNMPGVVAHACNPNIGGGRNKKVLGTHWPMTEPISKEGDGIPKDDSELL